ncbi:MAG: UDP-N-acetylmuramoyl-L-alanyl-D-glutamate--2,6-diaminopimelate ligase [Candidatus Eisenbacteria bacterium]
MASVPLGTLLTAISSLAPRARTSLPPEQTPVTGVCYDSRHLKRGELFVCLRGQTRDSHVFAPEALDRGALLAIGENEAIESQGAYLQVSDSRKAMALLADRLFDHPSLSIRIAAVTGTNGKTSITFMLESIFREARLRAAVLGTLGVGSPGPHADASALRPLGFTTPESSDLQRILAELRDAGVEALAMEVSSHALELRRTYGTRFVVAIFSNLTPDHLDFHHTMDAYAAAKGRLFRAAERGPESIPLIAVVNADDPWGERVVAGSDDQLLRYARRRDAEVRPRTLRLDASGIHLTIAHPGGETSLHSPLLGDFQVDNLLAAFAGGLAFGLDPDVVARGLEKLAGIPGRMERVEVGQPFLVVVDYAHTPDALARALASLKPFTRGRVLVVFGCGGERDRGKRPEMGRAAGLGADRVFLTDDNPRGEDPAVIRAEARRGLEASAVSFVEEGDRRRAIELALAEVEPGDTLLIAGKGHEPYQIRGSETLSFDDRAVARELLQALRVSRRGWESPAFVASEIARATNGATTGDLSGITVGYRAISTDTRSVKPHDLFVALRGERFDGHEFLEQAARGGAAAALVDRARTDLALPQIVVDDTLQAFTRWAGQHRVSWGGKPLIGLTGSSGKTTTKDLVAHLLRRDGPVWATEGNRNNHVGVPWTLLGLDSRHHAAVIEMGMNHSGEIAAHSRLARPTIGVITGVGTAHVGHLGSREAVLRAKFELLEGLAPDAPLVLHHDAWVLDRLPQSARTRRLITFGLEPEADLHPVGPVEWSLTGTRFTTPLAGPIELSLLGTGALLSALGALATLMALGCDLGAYAHRLARAPRQPMRMEPRVLGGISWLLDCYNASPESTRLALDFHREVGHAGRRVVVLGELGELGGESIPIHTELGARVRDVALALFVGQGARVAEAACTRVGEKRWFESAEAAASWLGDRLLPGDLVLLKGSRRSALERIFALIGGQEAEGGH